MQKYQITYSFGNSPNTSGLTTVVGAYNMLQARSMVESMYGGPGNCKVYSVVLVG